MKTTFEFDLSNGTKVIAENRDLAERMRRVYEGKEAIDPRVKKHFVGLGLIASPIREVRHD